MTWFAPGGRACPRPPAHSAGARVVELVEPTDPPAGGRVHGWSCLSRPPTHPRVHGWSSLSRPPTHPRVDGWSSLSRPPTHPRAGESIIRVYRAPDRFKLDRAPGHAPRPPR